jgi:hypothetical protein
MFKHFFTSRKFYDSLALTFFFFFARDKIGHFFVYLGRFWSSHFFSFLFFFARDKMGQLSHDKPGMASFYSRLVN